MIKMLFKRGSGVNMNYSLKHRHLHSGTSWQQSHIPDPHSSESLASITGWGCLMTSVDDMMRLKEEQGCGVQVTHVQYCHECETGIHKVPTDDAPATTLRIYNHLVKQTWGSTKHKRLIQISLCLSCILCEELQKESNHIITKALKKKAVSFEFFLFMVDVATTIRHQYWNLLH